MELSVNRLVRGLIAAALIVGSAQMWSTNTPPLVYGVSLFGALGYAFAAWLVVKLIRSTRE
jgi:ubiquinone biosynthesis protein